MRASNNRVSVDDDMIMCVKINDRVLVCRRCDCLPVAAAVAAMLLALVTIVG